MGGKDAAGISRSEDERVEGSGARRERAFQPRTLRELYGGDDLVISIEVFPPKSAGGDAALFQTLERLAPYQPQFISCTYGAGGSTRTRTVEICRTIQERYGITATAHYTCVGATRQELEAGLADIYRAGIRNIMALRGDPPRGEGRFQPVPGGLAHANELVSLIRERFPDVGIGVAGYPEKHPEAPDMATDLRNLKRKVEAGADAVFTQLFFVNESFLRFREACERIGIDVPIVPGIMPVTEYGRIKRITELCGAYFPPELADRLYELEGDADAQFAVGVDWAVRQCEELVAAGVPGFHFYALNRSPACEEILRRLGITVKAA